MRRHKTPFRYNNIGDKSRRVATRHGVEFAVRERMPTLYHRIVVRVRGCPGMEQQTSRMGEMFAYVNDSDYYPRRYRSFVIDIDTELPAEKYMITLFHEMVHVKQFALREMDQLDKPRNTTRWRQLRVKDDELDYWDLPWEVEAREQEGVLFNAFMENGRWKQLVQQIDQ